MAAKAAYAVIDEAADRIAETEHEAKPADDDEAEDEEDRRRDQAFGKRQPDAGGDEQDEQDALHGMNIAR
jgi:hypothetical protein